MLHSWMQGCKERENKKNLRNWPKTNNFLASALFYKITIQYKFEATEKCRLQRDERNPWVLDRCSLSSNQLNNILFSRLTQGLGSSWVTSFWNHIFSAHRRDPSWTTRGWQSWGSRPCPSPARYTPYSSRRPKCQVHRRWHTLNQLQESMECFKTEAK